MFFKSLMGALGLLLFVFLGKVNMLCFMKMIEIWKVRETQGVVVFLRVDNQSCSYGDVQEQKS